MVARAAAPPVAVEPAVEHPAAVARRVVFPVRVCRVARPVAAEPVVVRPVVGALQAAVPVVVPRAVGVAAAAQVQ